MTAKRFEACLERLQTHPVFCDVKMVKHNARLKPNSSGKKGVVCRNVCESQLSGSKLSVFKVLRLQWESGLGSWDWEYGTAAGAYRRE